MSEVVTDLSAAVHFVRELGDRDQVEIDREEWKVLSEVGSGASVAAVADALGTTEFWAARIAARLIDQDLVAFAGEEVASESEAAAESSAWDFGAGSEDDSATDAEAGEAVDPSESWWQEPEAEDAEAEDTMPEVPAEAVEEVADDAIESEAMPVVAAADQADTAEEPAATDDSESDSDEAPEVEEDTEAFLEKVFSELETEETAEEGYGLLRRRRMGAIRDGSNDS